MKFRATIDGVALVALVFAVIAIGAVSAVAIISAGKLISINEKMMRMQRTVSSLEAIRFHSFAINTSEQNYIITGRESELTPPQAATAEIAAEVTFLAERRAEHPELDRRFAELRETAREYVADEHGIAATRRSTDEQAAKEMLKSILATPAVTNYCRSPTSCWSVLENRWMRWKRNRLRMETRCTA